MYALWLFDEQLGLKPWKVIEHRVSSPSLGEGQLDLRLHARTRPPPIGGVDWPAGRVLLQYCLDHMPNDATGLELGAGIGTTALGLVLANGKNGGTHRRVVATDFDDEVLSILRKNASANGITPVESLTEENASLAVAKWDAAQGTVDALPAVSPSALTHVIGSDVVYFGGADSGLYDSGRGLVSTMVALCREQPRVEVILLCVSRAPAAISFNADCQSLKATAAKYNDPAQSGLPTSEGGYLPIEYFERKCASHGLRAERIPIPNDTVERVRAAQFCLV